MHDAQKTETQPLTGVQGQGGPRSHQGRRAPHHHRRALRRSSQPDHQVEAAAPGRCRRRLRGGRAGQGGWTLYRRAARQDRRADHGERFFVRCARSHERPERKAMIDRTHLLPVKTQAELLGISRGSVYYEPVGTGESDLTLMAAMDEIHLKLPFYGIRRIRGELLDRGLHVGRGHVATLMRKMGIEALYPKRRLSKRHPGHTVYPYLLRGVDITHAGQVWCADVTYLPMARGFCYLVAIMDWASRRVLSWRLSNTLDASFCIEALEEALARYGAPEIFNTDQGSQFASEGFTGLLQAHGVRISMDGRGRWMDNVFIERLWRSVKYEEVYLKGYETIPEARTELTAYFDFYNRRRRHQGLEDRTPDEVYWSTLLTERTAA